MNKVNGPWTAHFDGNMMWSNAALVTKGMAPYGAVALGEIDQMSLKPGTKNGSPWANVWKK
jgi:hypothetical protein